MAMQPKLAELRKLEEEGNKLNQSNEMTHMTIFGFFLFSLLE